MNANVPPVQNSPVTVPKRRRWGWYVLGGVVAMFLVIVASVAITIWWIQRPIKPVVLSQQERAVLDAKLRLVGMDRADAAFGQQPTAPTQRSGLKKVSTSQVPSGEALAEEPVSGASKRGAAFAEPSGDRTYVPGGKVLKLTEREANGLLNSNTDLGQTVRLEFARNAINAYLAVPIPEDFPIGGGKMFRARGRFQVSIGNDHAPRAVLEDITVFGLSLPNAWLGGIKGENLFNEIGGEDPQGKPILKGIKSLKVEPGALVLEVEE